MPLCSECRATFTPHDYWRICDVCGSQRERQLELMQEFRAGVLDIMQLSSRVVWGERGESKRVWRIG